MCREHRTATFDGGNKPLGNLSIAHVPDQLVNGGLPLRLPDLRGNALVRDNPGIVLCHRCEDQHGTAMSGVGETPQEELFDGPAMGAARRTARGTRAIRNGDQDKIRAAKMKTAICSKKMRCTDSCVKVDERPKSN